MLQRLADDIWHTTCEFRAKGLPTTTRMTVVRLPGKQLWLHSPVPIDTAMRAAIDALGTVAFIVAPSKTHHLFVAPCAAAYPLAQVFGVAGLREKRPDLDMLADLPAPGDSAPWKPMLEHLAFGGIPFGNESVWFHRPSSTLVFTDLVQWWQGAIPWRARAYASLTAVRAQLAVPRTVRALVRDRAAAARSAREVLAWPFQRIVMAHNAVIDHDARPQLTRALACFDREPGAGLKAAGS